MKVDGWMDGGIGKGKGKGSGVGLNDAGGPWHGPAAASTKDTV